MARKAKLVAQLPPTPCTPEMRESIVSIANEEGKSIADVMREAITFFLFENDSKSITHEREALKEVQ